jgi:hypothetical protein
MVATSFRNTGTRFETDVEEEEEEEEVDPTAAVRVVCCGSL